EKGEGKEIGLRRLVPRFQAQPEAQADAGMDPGDDEYRALEDAFRRIAVEIDGENRPVIAELGAEEGIGDARRQHVLDQNEGDEEAERILRRLDRAQTQRLALPQRVEGQHEMREERAIERDRHRPGRPEPIEPVEHPLHHVERDEAEAVIEEMREEIAEEDEAGGQSDPSDHPNLPYRVTRSATLLSRMAGLPNEAR